MNDLNRRVLLLGVSGSIAAYKCVALARYLLQRGVDVQPLLTEASKQFIGPSTWLGITGRPALDRIFDGEPGERHVDLWREASAMLIAPASADILARLAHGHADDLVTATALCRRGPLFVAPAMHPAMWENAATQRNVELLKADGVHFFGPAHGEVASGDVGAGRLLEPDALADRLLTALDAKQDLRGLHIVVSAGPTVEDIDPVRFISNRSSGKMGYAIASVAAQRGATVDLVSGPVALDPPTGVRLHGVRSALEMLAEMERRTTNCDAVIMAAAVGDFRPETVSDSKLKKTARREAAGGAQGRELRLVENPDIIKTLAQRRSSARPVLVAFAVETGDDEQIARHAKSKLEGKKVDLVVANAAEDGFGGEENRAQLVSALATEALPRMSKRALAGIVLDRVAAALDGATDG